MGHIKADHLPDYSYEQAECDNGYVIGVDEAGRGPWAGPVCAAAFWIHPHHLDNLPATLTDSKKLSAKKREDIYQFFNASPHLYESHMASVQVIDDIGILQANFQAMSRAIERLAEQLINTDPLHLAPLGKNQIAAVLIDGNLCPELRYPAQAVIKGDSRVLSIAAASIIAKQRRDHHMAQLHETYPHYGWDSNQGYGTKAHQAGLEMHGITPHHRTSFAPIKKHLLSSKT